MSKINVNGWKEFKVGKLFDIKGTKSLDVGHVTLTDDGDCQFIGRTNDNNGVQGNINSSTIEFDPNEPNNITVSQVGTITAQYRDHPYYTSQNILKLSMDNLSKNIALFFCGLINGRLRALGFVGYNTLKMNDLKNLTIKLPVTSTGAPDWNYMDEYIEKLATQAHKNVSSLATLKPVEHKIDIKAWKEFKVGKLFDVRPSKYVKQNGKTLINAELFDNGDHKVIVNTSTNNGIGGYTTQDFTEDGNVITFSDTTDGPSTMFYQDQPFVGYSHVKVMEPIDIIKNSRNVLLYLTATIRKALSLNDYNFTNKLTTQAMNNTSIKLPVTSTGQLDFDYMEKYIDNMQSEAHESLELLKQI